MNDRESPPIGFIIFFQYKTAFVQWPLTNQKHWVYSIDKMKFFIFIRGLKHGPRGRLVGSEMVQVGPGKIYL